MKSIVLIALLTIFGVFTVSGQIKIGDNPQNIDPASLLELESSSRVLVISRVSTPQMEAIVPQRGGVVYNTDTECLHYFDGTQWVNLCDAVSFNLTNDPIENINTTISIVDNGSSINLEVAPNSIRSENIVDGGINGDDIQDNSIGESKLGDDSVSSNELRDNSVGSSEIRDGSIQPTDIANTVADQVLTTDENGIVLWRDASGLQGATGDEITITGAGTVADPLTLTDAIQNNINDNTVTLATHILEDSDTDDQNETLTNARLEGNNLILTESGIETTLDLGPLNNSGTDNQTLNLAGNILEIERGNTVNLNGFLDNTDEQQLSINPAGTQISLTNGGTISLPAGTVNTDNQDLSLTGNTINISGGTGVDLTPILGGGATDGVVTNVALAGTDLNFTGANGGFNGSVSLAGLGGGAADGALTNVELAGTDLEFTSSAGGFTGAVSLAGLGGGGAADGVITNMELTGTDLIVTGTAPGFSGTIPLGTLGGGTDSQQLTLEQPGNLLTLVDGGTPIDLTPFLNNQTAGEVTVAATPANYTAATADVEGHLAGIDAALLNAATPNLANVLTVGSSAGNSQINDLLDPTLPQDAATRAYVETRIATILGAGGVDGVVTNAFLTGTEINFTGANGGFDGAIDLDPTFVTETELTDAVTASEALDLDIDPNNEIELPDDATATAGQILATNADGTYAWVDDQTGAATIVSADADQILTVGTDTGALLTNVAIDATFATDAEVADAITASAALDLDIDPNNEIELPDDTTATAGQILATNADGTYAWVDDQTGAATIVSADADQILTVGTDTGALLTNVAIDATFATDAEVADAITASAALDLDIDPNNEIELPDDTTATAGQILATNADGTYAWVDDQTGAATIVSADADQILTVGTDTGALLTNVAIDATFATDAEVADAITASAALDLDIDPNNEIELPDDATATAGQILATNADGTYAWVDDQTTAGTIVSTEADNAITASAVDGGAFYDDSALIATTAANAAAITANATAIGDKEDSANKSTDGTLADDTNTLFPTELAVKTYVDNQIGNVAAGDNLSNADLTQTGGDRTYNLNNQDLIFTGLGSVGIGNGANPPQNKFHVAGEIRVEGVNSADGTVANPAYTFSGDTNNDTGIFRPAADEIGFSAGGQEALRIEEDATNTNVIVFQSLQLDNLLLDKDGDSGTAGQILSSTGGQTDWINPPAGSSVVDNEGDDGLSNFDGANGYDINVDDTTIEIDTDALRVKGSANNGEVLTTVGGVATWAAPTAGAVNSDGTLDGDGQGTPLSIADDAINSARIADGTVTEDDLGDNSVNTNEIINQAVTEAKIAPGADGEVLTTVGGATTWATPTAGVVNSDGTLDGDGQGTPLSVADDAINSARIADGTVTEDDLGDNSVNTNEIINQAVTEAKIAPGANGQVLTTVSGAAIWAAPTAGAVTVDGTTIDGDGTAGDPLELADDAVTEVKIQDANVTTAKIAPGANGQVLTTVGTAATWASIPGGVVGMAKVEDNGNILKGTSGISVSGSGGIYVVDVSSLSLPDNNYIINVTISNPSTAAKSVMVSSQSSGSFTVNIVDSAGSGPIASGFFFTITDL